MGKKLSDELVPDAFALGDAVRLKISEIEIRQEELARVHMPFASWRFVRQGKLDYPIIVTAMNGGWLLLDGYSRLTGRMMAGDRYIDARPVVVPAGVNLLIASVVLNRQFNSPKRGIPEKLMRAYPGASPR